MAVFFFRERDIYADKDKPKLWFSLCFHYCCPKWQCLNPNHPFGRKLLQSVATYNNFKLDPANFSTAYFVPWNSIYYVGRRWNAVLTVLTNVGKISHKLCDPWHVFGNPSILVELSQNKSVWWDWSLGLCFGSSVEGICWMICGIWRDMWIVDM